VDILLKDFYAEKHIKVIYPKTPEAIINLEKVATSFKDGKTKEFIKLFIGNGTVSAKDLETIVPIFL
jgi:ferritin